MKKYHLQLGDNASEVYFLGYNLKLTRSEYQLLCALADAELVSSDELARIIGSEKRGTVAVHICSINAKARAIGERKLVLCKDSEYYLNENM